jgi:DNA-binding transcriptional ArsR family regulator
VTSPRAKSTASGRKRPAKTPAASPPRRKRADSSSAAASPGASWHGNGETNGDGAHWTFLTNHTHVLVVLSRHPSLVLREVAVQVGITERAVQRIIADLETAGVIEREKIGRQNQYRIRTERRLRHANESHRTIGELLSLLNRP